MDQIKLFKEDSWKSLIKHKSIEYILKYLNSKVGTKSKHYEKLKISNFLSSHSEETPIETAQFIAKVQSHMVETVRTNFKERYNPDLSANLAI